MRASIWLALFVVSAVAPSLAAAQQYRTAGHVIAFDDDGYRVSNGSYALRVTFAGARRSPPRADAAAPAEDPIPSLSRVAYDDLWPGVGVTYDTPTAGIARSTWRLAPGTDPRSIRLRYNRPVALTATGGLAIPFAGGVLAESRPIAWQQVGGRRHAVAVEFRRLAPDTIGFQVGAYRRDLPLVIDPTLRWNTFLGSAQADTGRALAVDAAGNIYVGGSSAASWGIPVTPKGIGDAGFVAKLAPDGTMIWNTFLGGMSTEIWEIAVDPAGAVYVAGGASGTWGNPVRPFAGNNLGDAVVAKLSSDGALLWNTFLGGTSDDRAYGVALDAAGNVYVSGNSRATWGSPVRPFTGNSGLTEDGFVAKLDGTGALVWNSFLGGDYHDYATTLAVDVAGNIFATGYSEATWGSPLRPFGTSRAAYVARLTPTGALVWNTFLGGTANSTGWAIALDANSNVYVGGQSGGTWGTPVRAFSASGDAFVAELTSDGALVWNTFLGGSGVDSCEAIAVAATGAVYVAGSSNAAWGSPIRAYSGTYDGYAAALTADGALSWHAFAGDAGNDFGFGIGVDADGNVALGGMSATTWGNPVRAYGGNTDAYVAQFGAAPPTPTDTATATVTVTATASATPTDTAADTATATAANTATATAVDTATPSATASSSPTASVTLSATPTRTATAIDTPTASATAVASATVTASATASATTTSTPTATASATLVPSATPTITPSVTPPTTSLAGCPAAPIATCDEAGSQRLTVRDPVSPARRSFKWKWNRGDDALALADLGDAAAATTVYTVCLYDQIGGTSVLTLGIAARGGGLCAGVPCWRALGSTGVMYRDRAGAAQGITKLLLRSGGAGRPKMQLQAAGASLPLPAPFGPTELFDQDAAVIVQLHLNDPAHCWSSTFTSAARNSAALFRAP